MSNAQALLKADLEHDGEALLKAVEYIEAQYDQLPVEKPDPASRTVITHILGPSHRPFYRLSADDQKLDAKIETALRRLDDQAIKLQG